MPWVDTGFIHAHFIEDSNSLHKKPLLVKAMHDNMHGLVQSKCVYVTSIDTNCYIFCSRLSFHSETSFVSCRSTMDNRNIATPNVECVPSC